jgi:hypothetical protein
VRGRCGGVANAGGADDAGDAADAVVPWTLGDSAGGICILDSVAAVVVDEEEEARTSAEWLLLR